MGHGLPVKRTWIKVKRGLFASKHVEAVGMSIWLFGLLIDKADWDTGVVRGYTDAQVAVELGVKPRTVRDWRQRLEKYEYIRCEQAHQAQTIQIHNWTHPREYSEGIVSRHKTLPVDVGDTIEASEGDIVVSPPLGHGDTQGDTQGIPKSVTLPLYHTHTSKGEEDHKVFDCPKCGGQVSESHRGTTIGTDCRFHSRPIHQWEAT